MARCIRDAWSDCSHDCPGCSECECETCTTCGEQFIWSDMEREGRDYYCPECYEAYCDAKTYEAFCEICGESFIAPLGDIKTRGDICPICYSCREVTA